MHNRMGIVAKRHQHADDGLEVQTSCHTTDLRVNASQSSGTTGSGVRFPVRNDSVNKPIDLRVRTRIPGTVTEAPQSLDSNSANDRVGVDNKFLSNISQIFSQMG